MAASTRFQHGDRLYGVLVGYFGMVIGLGAVALVVLGLTRGQLGYQTHQREDLEPAPT